MAKWRAAAIERLPEQRELIAHAENVMALWTELLQLLEKAYDVEPRQEALIAGIYAFADWCVQAPRTEEGERDPFTAVVVCFYEHIPSHRAARADMPRWFEYAEVVQSRSVFAYHIGDAAFDELVAYMFGNRHRYQSR